MPAEPTPGQLAGDEAALFERYGRRLVRVTAPAVNTMPENIDDACAFAWTELVARQPRRETVFAWLRTVARHEAIRLDRLSRRVDSLEFRLEVAGVEPPASRRTIETAHRLIETSEVLSELPDRLREVAFLRGAGWSYAETADRLGVSDTRINQLVGRANAKLHEIESREIEPRSNRARRLAELERDPPAYLVREIGVPPSTNPRNGSQELRREWRRLALAIDDFRTAHGITDTTATLKPASPTPARDELQHRVDEFTRTRRLSRGISR